MIAHVRLSPFGSRPSAVGYGPVPRPAVEGQRPKAEGREPTAEGRRLNAERRGAAAAELAILLPFMALTFSVVLDFCRAYHVTQTIQSSAHAAALYASGTATPPPDTTAEQAAKDAAVAEAASLQPPLDPACVIVVIGGSTAQVTVSYDFRLLTPLLGEAGSVTITRSATMEVAP